MVISQITDAVSSVSRIEEFLPAEEAEDDCLHDPENEHALPQIEFPAVSS